MKTFEQLGIAAPILQAIYELGYENPMPIQEEVIPYLLGNDNRPEQERQPPTDFPSSKRPIQNHSSPKQSS